MYGTYKFPAFRQNCLTRQKERNFNPPFDFNKNSARHAQTFVYKFAPFSTKCKFIIDSVIFIWILFFYLSIIIQLWPFVFLVITFQLPHNSILTFKWKHKSCRFIMPLSRYLGKQNMEIPERLRSALLWNSSVKKKII